MGLTRQERMDRVWEKAMRAKVIADYVRASRELFIHSGIDAPYEMRHEYTVKYNQALIELTSAGISPNSEEVCKAF